MPPPRPRHHPRLLSAPKHTVKINDHRPAILFHKIVLRLDVVVYKPKGMKMFHPGPQRREEMRAAPG